MGHRAKPLPPLAELQQRYSYCPESGDITFVSCYRKSWVGRKAGSVTTRHGRSEIRLRWQGGKIKAHRVAYKLMTGLEPNGYIDHINGDALDNRWENLRLVSPSVNAKNRKGHYGVYWHKKNEKWYARIADEGAEIWLGMFDSLLDAWSARKSAEQKLGYL